MGYGGYTASLQESFSIGAFGTGFISFRLFASGIGVYYFKSLLDVDATTKYNFDKNYMWSAMGGIDIGLAKKIDFEFKANYINIKERRYKIETTPATAGAWIDANDSVKQINFLPFIKYRFFDDLSGQAGIIYPFKTTQDSDITKKYDAKWKLVVSIEKRFGENEPSGSEVKDTVPVKKPAEIKKPETTGEDKILPYTAEEKVVNSTDDDEKPKKAKPKRKYKRKKKTR